MTSRLKAHFDEIWALDFEFYTGPAGADPPVSLCLVAKELFTGRAVRMWHDELIRLPKAPFNCGSRALAVAHYAAAELGCFIQLGWPFPMHVFDTYIEAKLLYNGREGLVQRQTESDDPIKYSLAALSVWFCHNNVDVHEKAEMRRLAMRGGPYTPEERKALIEYCESDVDALQAVFPRLVSQMESWQFDSSYELRGRYVKAVSRMEHNGAAPINIGLMNEVLDQIDVVKTKMIAEEISDENQLDLFGKTGLRKGPFAQYLNRRGYWAWDMEKGQPKTDDDTLARMSRIYGAEISELRAVQSILQGTKLPNLGVGTDGINRVLLSPFRSKTGRNQPSGNKCVWGLPPWLRQFIEPPPGYAFSYVDWTAQEFGIQAALSGDENMKIAYRTGDPYLGFAKLANRVPAAATKKSHPRERKLFKVAALAMAYGQGARGMARSHNISPTKAMNLILTHERVFPDYHEWIDRYVGTGYANGFLETPYQWRLYLDTAMDSPEPTRRTTCLNFPMQATGADLMRYAACLATEAGLCVWPIHDAFAIWSPVQDHQEHRSHLVEIMETATERMLGFKITAGVDKVVLPGGRYIDEERGVRFWNRVMRHIGRPDLHIADETPGGACSLD